MEYKIYILFIYNNNNFDLIVFLKIIPGPPFVFGAFTVALAIVVALFIPERNKRRQADMVDLENPNQLLPGQTPNQTMAPLIPHHQDPAIL
jgi:hypothetical protein